MDRIEVSNMIRDRLLVSGAQDLYRMNFVDFCADIIMEALEQEQRLHPSVESMKEVRALADQLSAQVDELLDDGS